CTFRLYLPRARVVSADAAHIRPREDLRGRDTIPVAEDDDQVRALAARALSQFGYRVIEVANGPQALHAFERVRAEVDLLLTDVIMPEMNGIELAEQLRPRRPDMKVLYMSGYTANAMEHLGLAAADNPLLQKPFTPEALARRIREVLDQ